MVIRTKICYDIMTFRADISLFARTKEWTILNLKMLWVSVNIDRSG